MVQRKVILSDSIHILVVDDNQINRQYFTMALKKHGYSIQHAESGLIAIELAKQFEFNIILMDMRMPHMDGKQAAIAIRKIKYYKNIPILAVSAEGNCNDCGDVFDEFLLKPISPQLLKSHVDKYTNNRQIKHFDKDKALQFAYNDTEIMQKIIGLFLQDLPIQINLLLDSLKHEKYQESLEIIHKLRGSCSTCGANIIDENLRSLSARIKNKEFGLIDYHYQRVLISIDDYKNSIDSIKTSDLSLN
jgi:two-component system sensor histidine kinase BarA